MVELVMVVCALVFAIYSLNAVFAASVIRGSESTPNEPAELNRRSASYDLERVAEPKQLHESWLAFLWVRTWRAIAAYVRCKRRTVPGRLDLLIVVAFLAAAGITWIDIADTVLELLRDYLERRTAGPA